MQAPFLIHSIHDFTTLTHYTDLIFNIKSVRDKQNMTQPTVQHRVLDS